MAFVPYLALPAERPEKVRVRKTATLLGPESKLRPSRSFSHLAPPMPNLTRSLQDLTGIRSESLRPGFSSGNVSPRTIRKSIPPPLSYLDSEDDAQSLMRLNINNLLRQRESEYVSISEFSVLCGTFNVNGRSPVGEDLKPWLSGNGVISVPDVIAVSFQELDNSNQAYLFSDSVREPEWCSCLAKAIRELYPNQAFAKFKVIRLVGIMLAIFIRDIHVNAIDHVDSDVVGCGLLGRMGNKGGVAVRFHLHDTSLCFVASHLSAHLEESDRRNQDFREINTRMEFSKVAILNDGEPLRIDHHDVVFWAGDLNYRLVELPIEKCKAAIDQGLFDKLFNDHDQLNLEMRFGKVLQGYSEGKIDFRPTYKYDTGTNRWDSSEKARIPAWCDRILWKVNADDIEGQVKLLNYRSHQGLTMSDHKPVSAVFKIKVRVVDVAKYGEVYKQILRDMDKNENKQRPQAEPDIREVDFGDVNFLESYTKSLCIKNTGAVPMEFLFKPTPNHRHCPAPRWLTITPCRGHIPVDGSVTIQLATRIDPSMVNEIALTRDRCFSDVLVLHLVCGGDTFIPVRGRLALTCFGLPLGALNSATSPVGLMTPAELESLMGTPPNELRKVFPVPKEVFRLVDRLQAEEALNHKELFRCQGTLQDKLKIRDALDTTSPGSAIPGSIQSVGEMLLDFLQSLPTSLIPESLQGACMSASSSTELCSALLDNTFKAKSPKHHALFLYLLKFLGEFVRHRKQNFIDITFLADVFAELCFRRHSPKDATSSDSHLPYQAVDFVLRLLAKEANISWEEVNAMSTFGGVSQA